MRAVPGVFGQSPLVDLGLGGLLGLPVLLAAFGGLFAGSDVLFVLAVELGRGGGVWVFSLLQFGQGVAGAAMHCLRVASGFQRVVCTIYSGHGGDLIDSGVSALDVAVDQSPVLLQVQPGVVVHLRRDEAVADVLHGFAAEFLQAGQFQHLLGGDAFGGVELEQAEDELLEVAVAFGEVALEGSAAGLELGEDGLGVGGVDGVEGLPRGQPGEL